MTLINGQQINYHHCHARGCTTEVKPQLLMCRRHWRMVSATAREFLVNSYRPGQCDGKVRVGWDWLIAARLAIDEVAAKESKA